MQIEGINGTIIANVIKVWQVGNVRKALLEEITGDRRIILSYVKGVPDTAKEVTGFIGDEHEPGNPRIPGWRRDYELITTPTRDPIAGMIRRDLRKWRNIGDPSKIVRVMEETGGYYRVTYPETLDIKISPPFTTQREAISHAVEWMKANPGTEQGISRIEGWEKGVPAGNSRGILRQEPELTPRELPQVTLMGKTWFFDERLKQIRNIENPHDYRDLTDQEVEQIKTLIRGTQNKRIYVENMQDNMSIADALEKAGYDAYGLIEYQWPDSDGAFYTDPNKTTKKIFVVWDENHIEVRDY